MRILDETSQVMQYSRQLEQKSHELAAATNKLQLANERLTELDRLKDEFVSTVSHELRTPLTSIRAFSEILQTDPDLPRKQRKQFLGIIVKEAERLTRLINNVLDLSKIESGRMEWHMQTVDLREMIADAIDGVGQLFRDRGVRLKRKLPDDPALVKADPDRLQQVIINLLSNACKFSPEVTGRVEIGLKVEEDRLRLRVIDNGRGIPPDQLERVFEKFHQVDGDSPGPGKGTGLGLSICRGIVEHHGGWIKAENRDNGGASFVCELPRA